MFWKFETLMILYIDLIFNTDEVSKNYSGGKIHWISVIIITLLL